MGHKTDMQILTPGPELGLGPSTGHRCDDLRCTKHAMGKSALVKPWSNLVNANLLEVSQSRVNHCTTQVAQQHQLVRPGMHSLATSKAGSQRSQSGPMCGVLAAGGGCQALQPASHGPGPSTACKWKCVCIIAMQGTSQAYNSLLPKSSFTQQTHNRHQAAYTVLRILTVHQC